MCALRSSVCLALWIAGHCGKPLSLPAGNFGAGNVLLLSPAKRLVNTQGGGFPGRVSCGPLISSIATTIVLTTFAGGNNMLMVSKLSAVALILFFLLVSDAAGQRPPQSAKAAVEVDRATLRPMEGQVVFYRSKLFGDLQPFALCATDLSNEPKPLLVDLNPATLSNVERAARNCEEICQIAKANGLACVALRPCGRGDGTVFQGYGEVDVYEAVAAVRKKLAIDTNRISLSGSSMGGAATWYHASHYPDFWSAAAPFCGYCDYKLWAKPGGTTFPWQPWEEPSWLGRDAAYRVENLRHVPMRIYHGEWDRAVGGGVPTEHSRQMDRKLTELGYPHTYVEVPKTGHGARQRRLWDEAVTWLLQQRRVTNPDRVSLVVHTLRHHKAYWLSVEQQENS